MFNQVNFHRRKRPINPPATLTLLAGVLLSTSWSSAQPRGCGGEGEPPCFIGGCDDGLGQDPLVFGSCSRCWAGSPPWWCNNDGLGREGEQPWDLTGIENLRTGRLCDTGLSVSGGTCVNNTRHSSRAANLRNGWRGRALRLQRQFNDDIPIGQGLYIGSHNSFNNSADGYAVFQHSYSLSDQLDFGCRELSLDLHASETFDPVHHLVRLSHAQNDHTGMSPYDRPLRHAIEEIDTWLTANPGEILLVQLENHSDDRANEVFAEFDSIFGEWLLRVGEVPNGNLALITPNQIRAMNRRVVLMNEGTFPSAGADRFFADVMQPGYPDNGVRDFYDNNMQFNADTNRSAAWQPAQVTQYEGSSGSSDDDPMDPESARRMVEAGVNIVSLDPMGLSIGGSVVSRPPVHYSIESLADAVIWSWAVNQPPMNSQPKAAKVVLVGPHVGRFVATTNLSEQHQVAALSANGVCWVIPPIATGFNSGESMAQTVGGAYHFRAPCNGYQMRRLVGEMERAGISEVWVNYADLAGNNSWTPATTPDDGSGFCTYDVFVSPLGNDFNPGTEESPLRTIHRAIQNTSDGGIVHLAPGTYTELLEAVTPARQITIQGSEFAPTIWSGNNTHRCLNVSAGANIVLRNLTITQGRTTAESAIGAGILVADGGRCELQNCTLTDNHNTGQFSVGGAAGGSGVIWATNSTFSGNSSNGRGGAIYVNGGQFRASFCTITSNTVTRSDGLGGGIRAVNNSDLLLYGNIIAGNTAAGDADISTTQPNHSDGYCIIGQHTSLLELTPTDISSSNPMLAPLASNGGPTMTHLPLPGSPAIDRFPSDVFSIVGDQRGASRPADGDANGTTLSDIGAVEYSVPLLPVIYVSPTGNDANAGNTSTAPFRTIANAIARAAGTATVYLAPGAYTEHDLVISGKTIAFVGDTSVPTEITPGANRRVFETRSGGNLICTDLNIVGGAVTLFGPGYGGAILTAPGTSAVLQRCTLSQNQARIGGAVFNLGAFSAIDCTFSGNFATVGGGALYSEGDVSLTSCTIFSNRSDGDCGGVYAFTGSCAISNSILQGNTAPNTSNRPDIQGVLSSGGYNLFADGGDAGGALAIGRSCVRGATQERARGACWTHETRPATGAGGGPAPPRLAGGGARSAPPRPSRGFGQPGARHRKRRGTRAVARSSHRSRERRR